MKKDADISGAEVAPTSETGGIDSGKGDLSIKVVWWKLLCMLVSLTTLRYQVGIVEESKWFTYTDWRFADISVVDPE